jgi:UDP-N-acetyl-D-mannosaminuronic acid dehydrogenase
LVQQERSITTKSFWCAEKIQNEKLQFELKYGRKPKTALMGLAFKPNY